MFTERIRVKNQVMVSGIDPAQIADQFHLWCTGTFFSLFFKSANGTTGFILQ